MNPYNDMNVPQTSQYSRPSSVCDSPRVVPETQPFVPSHSRSSSLSTDYFSEFDPNGQYHTTVSEEEDNDMYGQYPQHRMSQHQLSLPRSSSSTSISDRNAYSYYPYHEGYSAVNQPYPEDYPGNSFRGRAFSQSLRQGDVIPASPTHSTIHRRRVQSATDPFGFQTNCQPRQPSSREGSFRQSQRIPRSRGDSMLTASELPSYPLSAHGRPYEHVQELDRHATSGSSGVGTSGEEREGSASPELAAVLQSPFYHALWYSRDYNDLVQWAKEQNFKRKDTSNLLEDLIRQCIQSKKSCYVNRCRVQFLYLLKHFGGSIQVWIEFSRMEMESGNYVQAEFVLNTALLFHPRNLIVLGKLVKVEEKLQNTESLLRILLILRDLSSQKALQLIVDTAQSLARIGGDDFSTTQLLYHIVNSTESQPGWLYNDILQYFINYSGFTSLVSLVTVIVHKFPKHGPLWCSSLYIIEHSAVALWNQKSLADRCVSKMYDEVTCYAHKALTFDVLWKLYVVRLQCVARTIIVLRDLMTRPAGGRFSASEIEKAIHTQFVQLVADARACITFCPTNQRWRAFIWMGRIAVVLGLRQMARFCMKRSLLLCPKKNQHSVFYHFAKVEFFGFHQKEALFLLYKSTPMFLNEWKLQLEAANCLMFENRLADVIQLCRNVLQIQTGAGRFWAILIHFIHEYEIGAFFDNQVFWRR